MGICDLEQVTLSLCLRLLTCDIVVIEPSKVLDVKEGDRRRERVCVPETRRLGAPWLLAGWAGGTGRPTEPLAGAVGQCLNSRRLGA